MLRTKRANTDRYRDFQESGINRKRLQNSYN